MSTPAESRGRGRGRGKRELTSSERVNNWVNEREARRRAKERWTGLGTVEAVQPAGDPAKDVSDMEGPEAETDEQWRARKQSKQHGVALYVPPSLRGKMSSSSSTKPPDTQNPAEDSGQTKPTDVSSTPDADESGDATAKRRSKGRGRRRPEIQVYVPRAMRQKMQAGGGGGGGGSDVSESRDTSLESKDSQQVSGQFSDQLEHNVNCQDASDKGVKDNLSGGRAMESEGSRVNDDIVFSKKRKSDESLSKSKLGLDDKPLRPNPTSSPGDAGFEFYDPAVIAFMPAVPTDETITRPCDPAEQNSMQFNGNDSLLSTQSEDGDRSTAMESSFNSDVEELFQKNTNSFVTNEENNSSMAVSCDDSFHDAQSELDTSTGDATQKSDIQTSLRVIPDDADMPCRPVEDSSATDQPGEDSHPDSLSRQADSSVDEASFLSAVESQNQSGLAAEHNSESKDNDETDKQSQNIDSMAEPETEGLNELEQAHTHNENKDRLELKDSETVSVPPTTEICGVDQDIDVPVRLQSSAENEHESEWDEFFNKPDSAKRESKCANKYNESDKNSGSTHSVSTNQGDESSASKSDSTLNVAANCESGHNLVAGDKDNKNSSVTDKNFGDKLPESSVAGDCDSGPAAFEGMKCESHVTAIVPQGQTEEADGEDCEDSWDAMFDDNGDCLDDEQVAELTEYVGKVEIDKPKINYLQYERKEPETNFEVFNHIIEIYDFPPELATCDLITAFKDFASRGFDVKWVDDTHALGVFSSGVAANEALQMMHPMFKVRPMSKASRKGLNKAKHCQEFLQPYKARPQTTSLAARRLVAGALGMAPQVSREARDKERQKLKAAKEKRRQDRQQKVDIWDGSFGKCAMDEN